QVKQMPAMINDDGGEQFLLRFDIHHFGEPSTAMISINGISTKIPLKLGVNYKYIPVNGKAGDVIDNISVNINNEDHSSPITPITISPVSPITLYLLHHSHADIGYTHHQDVVERLHHDYFREAVQLADDTRNYPFGSRFKWNTEVTWAVESYLEQCSKDEKDAFIKAVQSGSIGLDGLWVNELTGLCRPEELIRLVQRSARVARQCGIELRSAMITDIPGYTWGLVPVMAKSGIRYFSPGTNVGHRIGNIKDVWGDKPFYWVSQSGKDSVLTWFPSRGYSWFHTGLGTDKPQNLLTEEPIFEYVDQLYQEDFPYNISIFRYNIGSDNGPPQPALSDIIKSWNEKYSTPQICIATTAEAFEIFEYNYGNTLPSFQGDLTPYWEDGAASSAKETAQVRAAAERLIQAQSLWVLSGNKDYPLEEIKTAWQNILLYDEHTWGSWNSISAPHDTFTTSQWDTKRSFALAADKISAEIMEQSVRALANKKEKVELTFDIWNTHSWPVSDVIFLQVPDEIANAYVVDANNNRLKTQRISDGRLAVLLKDVLPFAAKRIFIRSDDHVRIDPEPWLQIQDANISFNWERGDITAFRHPKLLGSMVDISNGYGLNSYFYVNGRNPEQWHCTRNTKITYPDKGKLLNTVRILSEAPGTDGVLREIMIIDELDRIDIRNTIYKTEVYDPEGLHFGFPFNIPGGETHIGIAWGYYRPEADQLPGSNKNFYTMNRWVDVSSEDQGVCLVSLDAPLIELGKMSMDAISCGWKDHQDTTQTIFSYVMNNYWETNYLAAQPGKAEFRYSLHLNDGFDPVENEKRSLERAQPLIVVPSSIKNHLARSMLRHDNQNVLITALIPYEDGGFLARLYNPGNTEQAVQVMWDPLSSVFHTISVCGIDGGNAEPLRGVLLMPAHSFKTLRVD
ncbi:MAG: hypothetical protein ABFS05_09730, partial [Bacteroidota bacterium]